ncbi:MAG: fibronectin type III domain-containing protein [Chloroflexota bacterium]
MKQTNPNRAKFVKLTGIALGLGLILFLNSTLPTAGATENYTLYLPITIGGVGQPGPDGDEDTIPLALEEAGTTIEGAAVISPYTGDDNQNNQAVAFYRPAGGAEWLPIQEVTVDYTNRQWNIGLAGLLPDTDYEVEVRYQDADGVTPPIVSTTVHTQIIYSTFFPVSTEVAAAGHEEEIRDALQAVQALGINLVIQSFAEDSTEADWQAFLDVAAEEGLWVIPGFQDAPPVWNGTDFDLGVNEPFLQAMSDHPAVYAYWLIDEPFHEKHNWTITAERLQLLYQQARAVAPNLPMAVQFSREIMRGEQNPGDTYDFRDGMCDICVISALEFRDFGDGPQFYSDVLIENHTISRAVIRREAPQAQIWTTAQVFGDAHGNSSYYMPSPAEVQAMTDLLLSPELQAAGQLNGIVWQQWTSPHLQQAPGQFTLGDVSMSGQREVVTETAVDLDLPLVP